MAKLSLLSIIDAYGVELIHSMWEVINSKGFYENGASNHRWIVGGKLCLTVNGKIIGWAWTPANAHDAWFHPVIEAFKDHCVILADTGFHAEEGDPTNMKLCQRV